MARCIGCGAALQYTDPKKPGYAPKEGSRYCQRCFRLSHYGDLTVSMKKGIDPDEVISRVDAMDCIVLWVADLFDFEAGMISGLSRRLPGKTVILAANKRDLLPETENQSFKGCLRRRGPSRPAADIRGSRDPDNPGCGYSAQAA